MSAVTIDMTVVVTKINLAICWKTRRNNVAKKVIYITSLYEVIIPFFKKYGFRSAYKKNNFRIFSEIVQIMYADGHRNQEGFRKVLELREKLNPGIGRKRKYTLLDVVTSEESSETIRKTVSNQ